jgi:formate dehydrogenase major subunit
VLGHDALDPSLLGGTDALAGLDALVVLDTRQSDLLHVAHVLLPVRHAAEKHGTLTNAAGRVQRVQPAVEPTWEAWSDGEVVAALGAALGLDGFDGAWDVREVSKQISQVEARFEGVHWDSVGDQGMLLARRDDA